MTKSLDHDLPLPRRLACARCGAEFCCGLSKDCWCAAEPMRLPMPGDSGDCLCPDCLRKAAADASAGHAA